MKEIMDILLKLKDETKYDVTITFKPSSNRQPVVALIPRREYKRLIRDIQRGKQTGTYEMLIESHVTEYTFPIPDVDTIHAVHEVQAVKKVK